MKLTLDNAPGANLVRGYSAQGIRIGEQLLTHSCIVTAERVVADFPPQSFAEFTVEHLGLVLGLAPELVLLGTGPVQQFAGAAMRAACAARGIGLESMELGAACRTYNVLVQEERRVAAALFLR
ncbi:MAG: hypothetical protein JSR36_17215 [Proteobacteria bacterium]|nr:hypothetical protein [Pseudomonadota bacterium]